MIAAGELCSGYGGLARAVEELFGARTAWHCEVDRRPALKLLGNGVVTAQAMAGIATALDLLDAPCVAGV